jgi:hypothetical protein
VTGWKRIFVCRELSYSSLPVLLLEEPDDLKAFRVALLENRTVRFFHVLEKAGIVKRLKDLGEEKTRIVKAYLPLLDLPPLDDSFRLLLKISGLGIEEKEKIFETNMSLAVIQKLVGFSDGERKMLYPLILPLGQNKQKELLESLYEISKRDGLPVREILSGERIRTVKADDKLSPLQKADRVRQLLKKRRFPMYSARKEEFNSSRRKIGWPEDIGISPAPYFEEEGISVEFSFDSKEELIKKLKDLHSAAAHKDFSGLLGTPSDE